jgi:hypothetical protein
MIATGPLTGALVDDLAGWRATLCASLAILLWLPALVPGLPPSRTGAEGSLDYRGAVLATITAGAIAALLQAHATHSTVLLSLAIALVAVVALLLTVRHLRSRPDAFLPLAVLRNRSLLRLALAASTLQAAYTGLIFAAPLLLARHSGWTALDTGIALCPGAVIAVAASNLSGTLGARRSAPHIFANLGGVSALGMMLAGVGASSAVLVVIGSLLTIGPYSCAQAVMLDRIPRLVAPEYGGAALGTFMYVFITGGAVGAAAVGGLDAVTGVPTAVEVTACVPLLGIAALRLIQPAKMGSNIAAATATATATASANASSTATAGASASASAK